MRTFLLLILSVALSIAGTLAFLKTDTKGSVVSQSAPKVAYDRVIESGVLRCGYATWPPFISKDPNTGAMSGILVESVEEIGKLLKLKIDWSYETGMGNYVEDLKSGRFDVMCATLWADDARIKNSLLIDPFLYSGVYVAVRADDARFDADIAALNDPAMKVTGIDGDITASLGANLFPKAGKVLLPSIANPAQMAENVKTKKADALFLDRGFFKEYDAANPGVLKILDRNPAWVFGERMAVNHGEWQLKYMLDTAIAELTNSGKFESIMARYPGTSTRAPLKTYAAD